MSYDDYQKVLEEKRQALADTLEIRKPSEGIKLDKKWANAKAIVKEEEEAFIAGSAKAKKDRKEQAKKQVVELDTKYYEAPSTGGRPTRGRGDGARRGGDRGGDRPFRGDGARGGRGRGDAPRGGRGRGDAFRGAPPRGGPRSGASLNTDDTNAFPSLGA